MYCEDCLENLDETPVGTPCPACGSERRGATIQASIVETVGIMDAVTVRLGHAKQKPWQRKWLELEHQLVDLEDYYANRPPLGNVAVENMVEGFFKTCREMADVLWHDPAASLAKADVMRFVRTEPDLRLCDAFAQTIKHNERTPTKANPDPLSARIDWFDDQLGVQLAWESLSGNTSGTVDALDLARRCKSAWQTYLTQHALL